MKVPILVFCFFMTRFFFVLLFFLAFICDTIGIHPLVRFLLVCIGKVPLFKASFFWENLFHSKGSFFAWSGYAGTHSHKNTER